MGPPNLAYVKPGGDFRFENVQAGNYCTRLLGAPAGMYIKDMELGSKLINKGVVTVSGALVTLDIVLGQMMNGINGRLESQPSNSGSNIAIVAASDTEGACGSQITVTPVTSEGTFEIHNMNPGAVHLFAVPQSETGLGAWSVLQFRKLLDEKQLTVTIKERGNQMITMPSIIDARELHNALSQSGLDGQ